MRSNPEERDRRNWNENNTLHESTCPLILKAAARPASSGSRCPNNRNCVGSFRPGVRKSRSLLLDKPATVYHPFMDDIAFVIDEREAVRADFIGSDDITALGRAKKGQADGGTEDGEKDAVLAFDAIQACFELCGGD